MSSLKKILKENKNLYTRILNHPFIEKLSNGSLDSDIFCYYLNQDKRYLQKYSKAISSIASRMDENKQILTFLQFAKECFDMETTHIDNFLAKYQYKETNDVTYTNLAYSNFLLSTSIREDLVLSVMSIFPCFYLYHELGLELVDKAGKDNPYYAWISLYDDKEFTKEVDMLTSLLDDMLHNQKKETLKKAEKIYQIGCIYEYNFFDDCYYKRNFFTL